MAHLENRVGELYENTYGTKFVIVKYVNNKEVYIRFLDDFNYEVKTYMSAINKGEVKNPYDKTICGVGYIGVDANGRLITGTTREYQLWRNMITRCYNEKALNNEPTYKNCKVCERWLCFANFLEDLPQIEGYELWVNNNNYELDKDMKQQGLQYKVYCLDNCCFIKQEENAYENSSRSCIRTKKKVMVINKESGESIIFNSTKECSKHFGFSDVYVSMLCRHKRTNKKYFFEYIDSSGK